MARATFNEVVMKSIAGENVEDEQICAIAQTYESVMSYPLERRKMIEREQKEQYQRNIELEKLRINQQHAMQGMGAQNMYGHAIRGY